MKPFDFALDDQFRELRPEGDRVVVTTREDEVLEWPVGKPVEVKVKGPYLGPLEEAAEELKAELAKMPGVLDVTDDYVEGKKEVRFNVDPERAAQYGLSVAQVGLAVRAAIDGVIADSFFDGDEEIDIRVKLDKSALDKPEDLLRLPLALPNGKSVALGSVAGFTVERDVAEIRRYKQQRAITVSANLDTDKTTTVGVNQALIERFKQIGKKYSGVSLDFSGEFEEFKNAFADLLRLITFGLLLVYAILGAQFRSYVQPLVILFTVPFAFVGAVIGLLIAGNPFSIITMFGFAALAGVAVNDAIVLVSFINRAKSSGVPPKQAVVDAGCLRLRPILLTSVTTVAGLLPMALGLGGESLTWGPLANTIVWGLSIGTGLTLFLIPPLYLIMVEDIAGGLSRLFRGQRAAEASEGAP